MTALFPPRNTWLWLAIGILMVIVLTLVTPFPFVATLLVALVLSILAYDRLSLRGFIAFLFWLIGAEFVLLAVLVALGSTLASVVAVSALILAGGIVLALILLLIGIFLFIIGNFVAD